MIEFDLDFEIVLRENIRFITEQYYRSSFKFISSLEGAYWIDNLRRPSAFHTFKRLLLWNHWAKCNQISYVASRSWGNEKS